MSMNYEILTMAISKSAVVVWHVIRDGFSSICGIRSATGLSKRQVQAVVKELLDSDLLIKIGFGCYKVRETAKGEREVALELRDIALEERKIAHHDDGSAKNRTDCAENRTDYAENRTDCAENRALDQGSAKNRTDCAENRALNPLVKSAKNRTDCAENRTDCAENRTDCAENRTLGEKAKCAQELPLKESKEKIRKEEDFSKKKNIAEMLSRVREEEWFMPTLSRVQKDFRDRDVSDDLLERIAAGINRCPGMEHDIMYKLREKAIQEQKEGTLKLRWMKYANYVKKCYVAAGYEWAPCRTADEIYIERKRAALTAQSESPPEANSSGSLRKEILNKAKELEPVESLRVRPSIPKHTTLQEHVAKHGPIEMEVLSREEWKSKYGQYPDSGNEDAVKAISILKAARAKNKELTNAKRSVSAGESGRSRKTG